MSIPELELSSDQFKDKSTILFGASKSGKSTVIVDILHKLKPHVDQILVISPTDRANNTYDCGIVPKPLIHYTITNKLLEDLWERQSALAAVYIRANNAATIQRLFNRIKNKERYVEYIENIDRKLQSNKEELRRNGESEASISSKSQQMEQNCADLKTRILKSAINKNSESLKNMTLTSDEKYTLTYVTLNPRLVIIFDDCTDLLNKFKTHPVMQKLFYQGRWAFLTILIACHTDKALAPELKKNAFVTIFTEETCARSYFERKSNDLDTEAKQKARQSCKATFTPLVPYQKLAFVREEGKFYRFEADKHTDFKFGSQALWDFTKQIESDPNSMNLENKFMQDFLI